MEVPPPSGRCVTLFLVKLCGHVPSKSMQCKRKRNDTSKSALRRHTNKPRLMKGQKHEGFSLAHCTAVDKPQDKKEHSTAQQRAF